MKKQLVLGLVLMSVVGGVNLLKGFVPLAPPINGVYEVSSKEQKELERLGVNIDRYKYCINSKELSSPEKTKKYGVRESCKKWAGPK
jgi:hypothetical protein